MRNGTAIRFCCMYIMAISLTTIFGHLFDAPALWKLGREPGMALTTAICLLTLAACLYRLAGRVRDIMNKLANSKDEMNDLERKLDNSTKHHDQKKAKTKAA